jgi:hypothetical protein
MRAPHRYLACAFAAVFAAGAASAAEPDWSKVPAKKIVVFYPGVSPLDFILKGTEHGGARGMKKGETCAGCHEEEAADMGKKMVTGQKLEPTPIKGKAGSIPVSVQAAHDGQHLWLRFSWKQPPSAGAPKQDPENQVKLAFMLEEHKLDGTVPLGGCWATCHRDLRTMPEAKDDKKTKYARGTVFDLVQWRSKGKPVDGHVSDRRVMEGGKALVSATGKLAGDTWTVTFVRRFSGGQGDVTLAPGKTVNFGFAIHDDWTHGRFHYVSLGYTLGIDAKADLNAVRP